MSCGKVVQKVADDKDDAPRFSLSFSIGNVSLVDTTKPLAMQSEIAAPGALLLESKKVTQNSFMSNKTTYINLKGYEGNKVRNLAWGKALVRVEKKEKKQKKEDNKGVTKNRKIEYITLYETMTFDKKKIKVTSPKETQFSAALSDASKKWTFSTVKVPKAYDYFLVSAHTQHDVYRMKVFNQLVVSGNKSVALSDLSKLDTFQALLFSEAFRTTDFTSSMYNALQDVFGANFFDSLQFVFPSLKEKGLTKHSPLIRFDDALIEECVFLLELIVVDKKEALAYLEANAKKLFSKSQKAALVAAIKQYESEKT